MKQRSLLHKSFFLSACILVLGLLMQTAPAAAQEAPSLPGQFAYVEDGIRLVMIQGSLATPILLVQAEDGLGLENPRFSKDGRYLAYCVHNLQAEDVPALYYLDTLTLEKTLVTANGSCSYDWSPEGDQLIVSAPPFLELSATLENGIWSYSRETEEIRLLVPSDIPVIDPRWSPDGHTISYYDFCFECVGQFYTYDLNSGEKKAWSQENSDQYIGPDMDWSPDGSSLVYDKALWMYTGEGETYGLETASSDGATRTELLSLPGQAAYFPIWSPDGTQIAFAAYESFTIGNYLNRRGDLMITDPDGSNVGTLYTSFYEVFPQAWSPDGRYLLFVEQLSVSSGDSQKQQLVLLDLEESLLVWKVSSFLSMSADWAPVPRPEQPATETPEPAPTSKPGAPTPLGTEPGASTGVTDPAATETTFVSNLQNGITEGLSWAVLFSICLCVGAGVAILVMLVYLWNWSRKVRKLAPPAPQETTVEAQPVPVAEPAPEAPQEDVEKAFRQGVEFVRAGKVEEGIAELTKVIAAQPGNNEAWFWLGIASVRQKDYRSAERCFLQAKKHGHPEADKALEWLTKQK